MAFFWKPATEEVLADCQRKLEQQTCLTKAFYPISPTETTYYVSQKSGNDENTGLEPSQAWKTCKKLEGILKCGDTVLFECGSVFRESVPMVNGVTYSSYGSGNKPRFYGSVNANGKEKWEEVSKNLYRYCEKIDKYNDIGNLVFNDGEAWGIKIQKCDDSDGSLALYDVSNGVNRYAQIESFPLSVGTELSTQYNLAYYHDADGSIYLVCQEGNPGEVFEEIELGQSVKTFMASNVEDVTICNLHFSNIACFAIRTAVCKNLTVRNCQFEFIGGAIQFGYENSSRNYRTRYGNAIENWGSCDGMTVENCSFYQIYDAAVSTQSNDTNADMKRISYCGNVFDKCEYGIELWTGSDDCWFDSTVIRENVCMGIGKGLSDQRPDKGPESFLNSNGKYRMRDCTVEDNLIWKSDHSLIRCNQIHTPQYADGFVMDRNTYVHKNGAQFGLLSKDFPEWGKLAPVPFTLETVEKLVANGFEPNGKFFFCD